MNIPQFKVYSRRIGNKNNKTYKSRWKLCFSYLKLDHNSAQWMMVFLTVWACEFGRNNYFAGTEQRTGEEPEGLWVAYVDIYSSVSFRLFILGSASLLPNSASSISIRRSQPQGWRHRRWSQPPGGGIGSLFGLGFRIRRCRTSNFYFSKIKIHVHKCFLILHIWKAYLQIYTYTYESGSRL